MEGTVELTEKDVETSPVGEPFADGYDGDIGRVLVTREQLQDKLRELGDQITREYEGRDLLLVAALHRLAQRLAGDPFVVADPPGGLGGRHTPRD